MTFVWSAHDARGRICDGKTFLRELIFSWGKTAKKHKYDLSLVNGVANFLCNNYSVAMHFSDFFHFKVCLKFIVFFKQNISDRSRCEYTSPTRGQYLILSDKVLDAFTESTCRQACTQERDFKCRSYSFLSEVSLYSIRGNGCEGGAICGH